MKVAGAGSSPRLAEVWTARHDRYSEQRAALGERVHALHKIEMNYIGG